MAKKRMGIICSVILIQFISVFGAESTEDIQEKETESFKNLPTLIEYVLDMLERKPEVLETDDVIVFKRNVDDNCIKSAGACSSTDTKYKRSSGNYYSPGDNSRIKHLNEYIPTDAVDKKNAGEVWGSNKIDKPNPGVYNGDFGPSDVTDVEGITIDQGNIIGNAKEETESDIVFDTVHNNYNVRNTKWSLMLSPEEVEEQLLKVDQMIEDYNSKEAQD